MRSVERRWGCNMQPRDMCMEGEALDYQHGRRPDPGGTGQHVDVPSHGWVIHVVPPVVAGAFLAIVLIGSSKDPAAEFWWLPKLRASAFSCARNAAYTGSDQYALYIWMCLLLLLAAVVAIVSRPLMDGMRDEMGDLLRDDFPVAYHRWLGDSHILWPTYIYHRSRCERKEFRRQFREREAGLPRCDRMEGRLKRWASSEVKDGVEARMKVSRPCRVVYVAFWVACTVLIVVFGSNALPRVSVAGRSVREGHDARDQGAWPAGHGLRRAPEGRGRDDGAAEAPEPRVCDQARDHRDRGDRRADGGGHGCRRRYPGRHCWIGGVGRQFSPRQERMRCAWLRALLMPWAGGLFAEYLVRLTADERTRQSSKNCLWHTSGRYALPVHGRDVSSTCGLDSHSIRHKVCLPVMACIFSSTL